MKRWVLINGVLLVVMLSSVGNGGQAVAADPWSDEQAKQFFQDIEHQLTRSEGDQAALQELWSMLVGAVNQGLLAEQWHPFASYVQGTIEAGIAVASTDGAEKDRYFSNAMSSLSRSAEQLPDYCPTHYVQGMILFEYYKKPEEALLKLDRAFTLCPEWPAVQEARMRVLQQSGEADTTSVPATTKQEPDEGIDFEPIPFD